MNIGGTDYWPHVASQSRSQGISSEFTMSDLFPKEVKLGRVPNTWYGVFSPPRFGVDDLGLVSAAPRPCKRHHELSTVRAFPFIAEQKERMLDTLFDFRA